ncbi:MAG: Na+/H+ antiporter subunit G [Bacteroidales bacterium]|nr:Na+/H+ antiporter subunit G [Bacteroidales bacterium]
MEWIKWLGAVMLLMGAFSLLVSAIGLLRMPDVYNRVQTGTKASTLGAIVSFIGVGLYQYENWGDGNWVGRVLVLIIFILLTNPVSSHVLMRAAYFMKVPLTKLTKTDKLKEDINNNIVKEPENE